MGVSGFHKEPQKSTESEGRYRKTYGDQSLDKRDGARDADTVSQKATSPGTPLPGYLDLDSDDEHLEGVLSDSASRLVSVMSALYGKILVIIGLCFPMAEVISHRIPIGWYEGFYLYLFLGSILCLMVLVLLRENEKKKPSVVSQLSTSLGLTQTDDQLLTPEDEESQFDAQSMNTSSMTEENSRRPIHLGSFYLRLGALAFGMGSMIYSGLELGQTFELDTTGQCYSFLYVLAPSAHMGFTFFQLYFIFTSTSLVSKHSLIARFSISHLIATNICVWLHVLVQETKHQVTILVGSKGTEEFGDEIVSTLNQFANASEEHSVNVIMKRSLEDHEPVFATHGQCRRSNIMGELLHDAGQFLFPCTIEYSLICAAILLVVWKQLGNDRVVSRRVVGETSSSKHSKNQYQVDCGKAQRGLFGGVFILFACILSLILFIVLTKIPEFKEFGLFQANAVELMVYSVNTVACLVAIIKVQELRFSIHHDAELDEILLSVAQFGLFVFNVFSMIGGYFYENNRNTSMVLIISLASLIQATLQTTFIFDATRRCCRSDEQVERKPGREMVTFLLVSNIAMWAINTVETRRAESSIVQMQFYGFWGWTIITHVTIPLTIFYRFHSTVCLFDIWKRAYKLRK